MKSTIAFASLASLAAASVVAPRSYPVPSPSQKSCPAPGTTTPEGDYLCNPAHQYPAGQTCELVDGCYVLRGTSTSTASSYPSPSQKSCPAPGTTTPEGDYLCNPAHQYPAGQTCELVDGCYVLRGTVTSTASSYPVPSETSCPAPGSYNEAGQYMCNPAHQYPEGQTCELVDGCYVLQNCDTTTSSVPEPTASACPAPGSYNAAGQYMCNPAHQYPEGQTCELVDGCYVLQDCATTTSSVVPEPTTTCPAPGSTDAAGRYSCNPAHQYPEGQTCELVDGCYFLQDCATTTSPEPKPTTTACPAPGSTDAAGRYSCNPAHQYPAGQTCELIDHCYFLVSTVTSSPPAPEPTTTCPAPGSYNNAGDYMCNPAHQYPAGQTCVLVDGCYVLRGTGASTTVVVPVPTGTNNGTHTTSVPSPTFVPGAASGFKASSMSVMAGLMAAVYFAL